LPAIWKSAKLSWTDICTLRKQIPLRWNRGWTPQVLVRLACSNPPSRCTPQEALLKEEGLIDILDGVARLAQRGGDGVDAHGAAVVVLDDDEQEAPVHLVEPGAVDLEPLGRGLGDGRGDGPLAEDLGEVAGAAEDPVGDARCPPRSGRDLARAVRIDGHI